jgi:hypothetical protein
LRVGDPAPLAGLPAEVRRRRLDGTFGIAGLMPARTVSACLARRRRLAAGTRDRPRARQSRRRLDAFDVPFTLAPNQSVFGVKVEMTYKASMLAGRVRNANGSAAGSQSCSSFQPTQILGV